MTPDGFERVIGDRRQIASVRRIVLDEGAERGVRALLFSTGGGLDFMVLADRSLDIGTVHYRGVPIAWQSPAGFPNPALHRPQDDNGRGFGRGFSGFMLTCGLDHIRQPSGDAPLHGRLPFTPARITACGEAWDCAEPVLFCEGEITQFRHGGESFRLFRRIEAPIGGTAIRIRDRVLNAANAPWPHAILYHLNLGYPAVRPGTTVRLGGEAVFGPVEILPQASAGPPVCHPVSAGRAECVVESGAEADAFRLSCGFDGAALPFLQVWADLTAHAGVLSIEPCTSDRLPQGGSVDARPLAAREERTYGLDLDLTGQAPALGRIGE